MVILILFWHQMCNMKGFYFALSCFLSCISCYTGGCFYQTWLKFHIIILGYVQVDAKCLSSVFRQFLFYSSLCIRSVREDIPNVVISLTVSYSPAIHTCYLNFVYKGQPIRRQLVKRVGKEQRTACFIQWMNQGSNIDKDYFWTVSHAKQL